MSDKKFSDFTVQTDLSNFDGLVGFDTGNNYKITPTNLAASLDLDSFTTGKLAIAQGGTSSTTAQTAIDTLTNVSGASAGHVLTKDGSGNATFQAPASGGGGVFTQVFINHNNFDGTAGTAPTGFPFQGPYNAGTPMTNATIRIVPYFVPVDCTLTAIYWKWCGVDAIGANAAGDISDLFIYTYTGGNTKPELSAGWDTTGDNATAVFSELVNQADDGDWPQKSVTGLSRTFTAGQVIMPFNIERGGASINPSNNSWATLQLVFEAT